MQTVPQQHQHTITIFFSDFIAIFHLKMQNLPYLAIFCVHSGHCIPVPFCSGPFRGLFWCKYQNNKIPKILLVNSTGMPPESAGMTGIWQESVGHEQELKQLMGGYH
jgi:hypothetical protein